MLHIAKRISGANYGFLAFFSASTQFGVKQRKWDGSNGSIEGLITDSISVIYRSRLEACSGFMDFMTPVSELEFG